VSSSTCRNSRCGRVAIADGLCRRCYVYRRRHGQPPDLTGPQVGDPAGYGTYGRMLRQQDTALCHECGGWFASVGAHAYFAHGLTAAEYRRRYGLARRQPLVSLARSEEISARSKAQVGTDAWRRLEARRDPTAASRSRDREAFQPRPPVAQQSAARAAANSARQTQSHPCRVCGRQIPGWRGADDHRTLCGRKACKKQVGHHVARAAGATRAAQARPLTVDQIDRLRALDGAELAAYVRFLYGLGVRQSHIAQALGVSASTVYRIAPYRQKSSGDAT